MEDPKTLTFLMTDIEGSTRHWQSDRETMKVALESHNRLVTDAVVRHGGRVVKDRGEGDSFFVVFNSAQSAVAASVDIQRVLSEHAWPTKSAIRVRVALISGEPELAADGDYYGEVVSRCARLREISQGGQIVLGSSTAALARANLPAGTTLEEIGEVRLRDLDRSEVVFRLRRPDPDQDLRPLKGELPQPTNLPPALTRFLGRRREMAELERRLRSQRLITFKGAPGCGKSRLAVELGREVLPAYRDGVWFVDLEGAVQAPSIAHVIAMALAIREEPGQQIEESLLSALARRRLVLILDGAEQVLEAAAELSVRLLYRCPGIALVVTSQEPLRVAGEQVHQVEPLEPPSEGEGPQSQRQNDAVRLFIETARMKRDDYAADDVDLALISEICRRLDGIPLAIELAAARTQHFPVKTISKLLAERFTLLAGGSRGAPTRHQTMYAAIDWGYQLLDSRERSLFERTSIFQEGFLIEGAQRLLKGTSIPNNVVPALLANLVDQSLLMPYRDQLGEARYRYLNSIREFGLSKLSASGTTDKVSEYGVAFLVDYVARLNRRDVRDLDALKLLDQEMSNIRFALARLIEHRDAVRGLQVCLHLYDYWRRRAHWQEARSWFQRFLELPTKLPIPEALRTDAMLSLAYILLQQNDFDTAVAVARECIDHLQPADQRNRARALERIGTAEINRGRHEAASESFAKALAIAQSINDSHLIATLKGAQGEVAYHQLDFTRARTLIGEATREYERHHESRSLAPAWNNMGLAYLEDGNPEIALTQFEKALDEHRRQDDRRGEAIALVNVGLASTAVGRAGAARAALDASLRGFVAIGDRRGMAYALEGCAALLASAGAVDTAVQLDAAARALRDGLNAPRTAVEERRAATWLASARAQLGTRFTALEAAGTQLDPADAVSLALAANASVVRGS